MKLQPYVDKLASSKEYRDFQSKYKDAFVVAGFFILDLEFGRSMHQIDYYIPSKNKIAAFTLDDKVTLQVLKAMSRKAPEKLDIKTKIDLDALKGILQDEMKNRSMTEDIRKIIAIVQTIDGKKIWNLNCVLSGMELLRAHVDDDSKTVLKMERASILDYIKRIPPEMLMPKGQKGMNNIKAIQGKQPQMQSQIQPQTQPQLQQDNIEEADESYEAEEGQAGVGGELSDETAEKIKALEEMKKALEKEKQAVQQQEKPKRGRKAKGKSTQNA